MPFSLRNKHRSQVMQIYLRYLLESTPIEVKSFGLTPEGSKDLVLEDLITSRNTDLNQYSFTNPTLYSDDSIFSEMLKPSTLLLTFDNELSLILKKLVQSDFSRDFDESTNSGTFLHEKLPNYQGLLASKLNIFTIADFLKEDFRTHNIQNPLESMPQNGFFTLNYQQRLRGFYLKQVINPIQQQSQKIVSKLMSSDYQIS